MTSVVNALVVITVLLIAAVLFHPRMVSSSRWRAMVTPLASIIGRGFLVLAPLLIRSFGVGAAIRWNIK